MNRSAVCASSRQGYVKAMSYGFSSNLTLDQSLLRLWADANPTKVIQTLSPFAECSDRERGDTLPVSRGRRAPTPSINGEDMSATTTVGESRAQRDSIASPLPDYAPIPKSALGPALNEQGFYVGRVERNLYWVTDGVYQSAFLTTRDGVVLLDAPPTIGNNLRRAVDEIVPATSLFYSWKHFIGGHLGRPRYVLRRAPASALHERYRPKRQDCNHEGRVRSVSREMLRRRMVRSHTRRARHHGGPS